MGLSDSTDCDMVTLSSAEVLTRLAKAISEELPVFPFKSLLGLSTSGDAALLPAGDEQLLRLLAESVEVKREMTLPLVELELVVDDDEDDEELDRDRFPLARAALGQEIMVRSFLSERESVDAVRVGSRDGSVDSRVISQDQIPQSLVCVEKKYVLSWQCRRVQTRSKVSASRCQR
jgi:hypothetical protein